uniref:Reverse transcriptase zinc-binding domain-containing protein n=1 Tax=Chenopodium quinoa TaxID=63459 RepID=A0A803MXT4_CHEQI
MDGKEILAHQVRDDPSMGDLLYWGGSLKGRFTIKSAIKIIRGDDDAPADGSWELVWNLRVLQRVKVLLWLILHDRLMHNVNRFKRDLTNDPKCKVCPEHDETMAHVLRDCRAAREIWKQERNEMSPEIWPSYFALAIWWIWKWRCNVAFDKGDENPIDIRTFLLARFEETWRVLGDGEQNPNATSGQRVEALIRWLAPPVGPMYYKGLYHLFYQYNPWGSTWGNIVWAHSVSRDLINWEALEPALHESKPFDINGVWSGSATILPGNRPVILYTGLTATSVQVQNVAIPANLSDPYLRKWVKSNYNPIITPTSDVNTSLFRDLTTAWWSQGYWHIVVGSRRKHRGMAYLYKSRDFKKWTKAKHPLHSAPNTGMWECPDFFPVSTRGKNGLDTSTTGSNVKHVLKVSLDVTRFEYYTIGKYDANKGRYVPDNAKIDGWNGLRFDYDITALKGWAGIQAIPRSIWLDPKGKQLVQWPVEEVERLRANKVELNNRPLKSGNRFEIKGITTVQADVEVTFKIPNLEKADIFNSNWVDPQDLCIQMGSNVRGNNRDIVYDGGGSYGIVETAFCAEAKACLGALTWALAKGFKRIAMYTDCAALVVGVILLFL